MKTFRWNFILGLICFWGAVACTKNTKPQIVIYGKDVCTHCHMNISDPRFGAQIVTSKGKIYHFDSVNCLHAYRKNHPSPDDQIYFVDSFKKDQWHSLKETAFALAPNLRSPMGAGILSAHRASSEELLLKANQFSTTTEVNETTFRQGILKWEQLDQDLAAGKFK